MTRRVVVLGSTGSIGEQALEVIALAGDELEVVGLAVGSAWEKGFKQADAAGVARVAVAEPAAAVEAGARHPGVLKGEAGVLELIATSNADIVLNAITGSAGLGATVVALSEGITLALANKESLVVGGELVTTLAEATGTQILPVDSEHSALFQLIGSEPPGSVDRLVLTASGGPFREREDIDDVTVAEALAHPTWEMGGRISIDSATLFNKGLELIEAHHLFGVPYERIDVVVHPQSIIHSLVHLNDGASMAHMGYPDMRVPISYALHESSRADVPVPALDLPTIGSLSFEEPDLDRFPCLRLAREAGMAGGTAPCVLNAADEVAVAAFMAERVPFAAIPRVVARTLDEMPAAQPSHFEDLYAVDEEARARAGAVVEELAR